MAATIATESTNCHRSTKAEPLHCRARFPPSPAGANRRILTRYTSASGEHTERSITPGPTSASRRVRSGFADLSFGGVPDRVRDVSGGFPLAVRVVLFC